MKPRPVPLGLCVARTGSVMPLPSGPRPVPGLQPMLCSIRLPMLESGIGAAFSPTTAEREVTGQRSQQSSSRPRPSNTRSPHHFIHILPNTRCRNSVTFDHQMTIRSRESNWMFLSKKKKSIPEIWDHVFEDGAEMRSQ